MGERGLIVDNDYQIHLGFKLLPPECRNSLFLFVIPQGSAFLPWNAWAYR